MSKTNWLKTRVFVDEYGRDYNLSDVPMTYMTREAALKKKGLKENEIDELYKEAVKKQQEFNNG